MPTLDPHTTALILVDLQEGIVAIPGLAPRPASDVVAGAKNLAARFREAGAPVALVHVAFGDGDRPSRKVDRPMALPPVTPPDFSQFVEGLRQPGDIVVVKHHWGAFIGTDLDLQLRRRGVTTVVIAGIATNMGVESTVRSAWELSYDVVVVEDLCGSRSEAMHAFAIDDIFPSIARVVQAEQVDLAIA